MGCWLEGISGLFVFCCWWCKLGDWFWFYYFDYVSCSIWLVEEFYSNLWGNFSIGWRLYDCCGSIYLCGVVCICYLGGFLFSCVVWLGYFEK